MEKTYVTPQTLTVVFDFESLVLCASSTSGGSAFADDFVKDDLTGSNDFWN